MFRLALRAVVLAAVCLTGAGSLVYPVEAVAQQVEPQQTFARRMTTRIDAVQSQIRSLERELRGDDESADSSYETDSAVLQQLKALDEQCRSMKRELHGLTIPLSAEEEYWRQRNFENYVRGVESRFRDIRKWVRSGDDADEPTDTPEEAPPGPDTVEDGVSDEEWAEEWAKGGS